MPSSPARVKDVTDALEEFAPLWGAESWDNVGLLLGSAEHQVASALLTIDLTPEVATEAVSAGAQLIIAYHPIMFQAVKRITTDTPGGRIVLTLARNEVAVYAPHTALDAAGGGMTDWLADSVGAGYRRPILSQTRLPDTGELKIVTFVPLDAADRVRDALATAGAGLIGSYELCSFMSPGTGTFRGKEGSKPAVGQPGRLERTPEIRLEMVCGKSALHLAMQTLRQFHPYEQPAIDVFPLQPLPHDSIGQGRKVVLDQPTTAGDLARRVKEYLGIEAVKFTDPARPVRCVGVVCGSGASMLDSALAQGCDAFVTGEMTHHEALAAEMRGCSVILTGHTNSERGYLPKLRDRLSGRLPHVRFSVSERDRTRFNVR